MTTGSDILKRIKDEGIKYVDLRFTDPRGKLQHVTFDQTMIDEDIFEEGTMFDGSSIAGWKAINESDMVLMPDPDSAYMDPFFGASTLAINCDVLEPLTYQPYSPRSAHHRQEGRGVCEVARHRRQRVFRPRARILHLRRREVFQHHLQGRLRGQLVGTADQQRHRLRAGQLTATTSASRRATSRCRRSTARRTCAARCWPRWAPWACRSKSTTTKWPRPSMSSASSSARSSRPPNSVQIYKYVIHQVANAYGKTVTFMPKPVYGDNGSGMHCHQSIWKDGKPLFAGDQYAGLSMDALYYIGGIIKHAKAINAFTNPTTNSYKRLVPGFEAPVLLAYSARNRSASCRIPFGQSPKAKRVEVRFPDPLANPYLGFAAMLMAGLDGIKNKIHPGDPMDKDLYELPPEELKLIPTVCGSLRQALEELDKDRDFLKAGDVFDDDMIDSYIDLKMTEVIKFEHTPHPVEYEMYYSA